MNVGIQSVGRIGPGTTVPAATGQPATGHGAPGFGALLQEALASVNRYQLEAEEAVTSLALGEVRDVHSVMIAATKADLALQLTIQVRNKVIEAYQEISRMQM